MVPKHTGRLVLTNHSVFHPLPYQLASQEPTDLRTVSGPSFSVSFFMAVTFTTPISKLELRVWLVQNSSLPEDCQE